MIPFIRSLAELMVLTESRDNKRGDGQAKISINVTEDSGQRKRYLRSIVERKEIGLPDKPKITRRKWIKSKKAVSNFLDELDYNNQIQSSYDLTLLDSQDRRDNHDAA